MRRNKTARRVAFTAVFTALAVAFIYLAALLPTGQLGFLGLASLCGVAAVVEYGLPGGLFVWMGGSVLGLLIAPSKNLALLYAVFFGAYPVVKSLAEKPKSRLLEWCVKLLLFNAALTVALFALKMTVFDLSNVRFGKAILYLLGNAVFVLFDIAVSRAIGAYMGRIHPKIK